MSPCTRTISALLLCGSAVAGPAMDPAPAVGVSPGGIEAPTWLSDPCPTFSWGSVPGAEGYELAVFWALGNSETTYEEQYAQQEPVLVARIAAPALSWTPDAERCLEEGGSYLWFLRAQDEMDAGPWSEGRRFEIDLEGGILERTVRAEVTRQLAQPDIWKPIVQEILGTESTTIVRGSVPRSVAKVTVTDASSTAIARSTQRRNPGASRAGAPMMTREATFPSPSALRVSSVNGVVFDEPPGVPVGNIPAAGPGTRFMWYPRKGALRAGYVNSDQWDDANIGDNSTAFGASTQAKGVESFAVGSGTRANGSWSVAIGSSSMAQGDSSTAIGPYAEANGKKSTAFGNHAAANGESSFAMGADTTAESINETVIGTRDTDYAGNPQVWVDTDRLFVIGNGRSTLPEGRSDAMVVLKNGNTGIVDSVPPSKLTIGNNVSSGDITDFSQYQILLYEAAGHPDVSYGMAIQDYAMVFNSDRDYKFLRDGSIVDMFINNGKVGIGQASPGYKLDVAGDINTATSYRVDGACVAGTCTSDRRLKEGVESLESSLEKIARLQPSRYRFTDEQYGTGVQYGLVAQEAEEVIPEIVVVGEDGYKRIRYGLELQMHMLQAIKELKAENDRMKALSAELRAEVLALTDLKKLVCAEHPGAAVCQ